MGAAKSISELQRKLMDIVNSVMVNDVAPMVIDKAIEVGGKVVYDSYSASPMVYVRRGLGEGDGLLGKDSYSTENTSDGTIEVRSTADINPNFPPLPGYSVDSLARLIEGGPGPRSFYKEAHHSTGSFRKPRPFITETIKELSESDECADALKKGLRKRGLIVE